MGRSDAELDKRDNKRARAKASRSRRAANVGGFDIAAIEWLPLVALVEVLAAEGGAVRIGLTRDAGALALGIYLGDDYATEYVKPNEDFAAAIEEIAVAWMPDNGDGYRVALQHLYQRAAKK